MGKVQEQDAKAQILCYFSFKGPFLAGPYLSLAKAYFSRKLPFYELNHAEPYLTKAEFAYLQYFPFLYAKPEIPYL